jgi:hypothetical protein
MFALTVLVYPAVLAVLCVGAGLLVDRLSGRFFPASLLLVVGAATLIAASQLTTYASPLAPATPYALAAIAVSGFALARGRVASLARRWRAGWWQVATPVLAYVLALAPVLFAGRPTFSSYMALTDSAVHMLGADYLIRHGQDYSHLDLRNSTGQFINAYYNSSYPSGADTLFGGSAFLLRVPLIWAFQPFNAFMLATATGPASLLARRMGLRGALAGLAAISASVSALVYGFELVGSIKEITVLPMILTLGALVVLHKRWLRGGAAAAVPFALVAAAGCSVLGAGFAPWVLAAVTILAAVALGYALAARRAPHGTLPPAGGQVVNLDYRLSARRSLLLAGAGAMVLFICALPTWLDLSGSLQVARNISSTTHAGNLRAPLHAAQLFGAWLWSSYKLQPKGRALELTHVFVVVAFIAALLGTLHLFRIRAYALAGWLALTLAVWLGATAYSTTWVNGKTLMLTSPLVVLVAWGGVAEVRRASWLGPLASVAAASLAATLALGVLASDAMQYHSSNLAPTARYEELASLNGRFAGMGPTLFTDFDEYAMYELRNLNVGGVDFIYPPLALARVATGHGTAINLDLLPASDLRGYPLIVTRRNPIASRPPSAYSLIWQGAYYQVWRRGANAPAALVHAGLSSISPVRCPLVKRLASIGARAGATLVAAHPPALVLISVRRAHHPPAWTDSSAGLAMQGAGRLWSTFAVPRAGVWEVWMQGEIMRPVRVSVDGRDLGSIGGQLGGNSVNPDAIGPLTVRLSRGRHLLSISRKGASLAAGDGGWAYLDRVFLAPAGAAGLGVLRRVPAASWRSLCGHEFDWIEVVPPTVRS